MQLDELLAEYCKYKILRPASISNYAQAVRSLQLHFESQDQPTATPCLASLSVGHLLAHRAWCLGRMSAISYNKHRRHLRALLNFAVAQEWLAVTPLAKVSMAPAGIRRPKVVPTSWYKRAMLLLDQEVVIGLRPAFFWKTVFAVMHFTAMRRRQVLQLRWQDVLWAKSALLLDCEGSKSRREWVVPVPRWLMQDIKALRERIVATTGQPVADSDQVFALPKFAPKIKATRMTKNHISRAFEALSRNLGYTISAHRVRHTSATTMLNATGHLKAVSDILGHSDIKLTASTYIHPQIGHLRRVQAALSGYKPTEGSGDR